MPTLPPAPAEAGSPGGSGSRPMLTVYWWCLSFLKPYKWRFAVFVATGIAFTLAELLVPKCIQLFIDRILQQKNAPQLFALLGGIAALLVLMYVSRLVHMLQQRALQEKAARDVQYSLFAKLRELGFSYFEKHPIGESLSLLSTEVAALQQLYRDKFPASIRYFLFSAISAAIMFTLSWQLSLVMIPCLILYNAVGPYFEKKASLEAKAVAQKRIGFSQKTTAAEQGTHE